MERHSASAEGRASKGGKKKKVDLMQGQRTVKACHTDCLRRTGRCKQARNGRWAANGDDVGGTRMLKNAHASLTHARITHASLASLGERHRSRGAVVYRVHARQQVVTFSFFSFSLSHFFFDLVPRRATGAENVSLLFRPEACLGLPMYAPEGPTARAARHRFARQHRNTASSPGWRW